MISLPSKNGRWSVSPDKDGFADLVRTRNIDMSIDGLISIAGKAINLYTSTDSADFGLPLAIVFDGTNYNIVTRGGIFQTTDGITLSEVNTTGQPSLGSWTDACMFGTSPVVHVSGDTTVKSYSGTTWTSRITGLSSSNPHPICEFENKTQLAVADGNVVTTYDTSYSLQKTLTIPSRYIVTTMRWRQNNLYMGTRDTYTGRAKLFIWNGATNDAQSAYGVKADWIYSVEDFKDSIVCLTSRGQILRFNGGGFDVLENFPVYYTSSGWSSTAANSSLIGRCANRGMISDGSRLYINIDGSVQTSQVGANFPYSIVKQPSGLWVLDESGLYHKGGYPYSKYTTLSGNSLSSSIIDLNGTSHGLNTGDPVYVSAVGSITGISAQLVYYIIATTTTTFQLALSPADAQNSLPIVLGGAATSSTFIVDIFDSFGGTEGGAGTNGAVGLLTSVLFNSFFSTNVLYGGNARSPSSISTTRPSLFAIGMNPNIASFVTSFIPAEAVTDIFSKIFSDISRLYLNSEKIIIKYRTAERFGVPTPLRVSSSGVITWVDTTHFTVDTSVRDFKSVQMGDEIEIISGAGAGRTAHVLSVEPNTPSSTTLKITLDEAIPLVTANQVSEVVADNWTKLLVVTNSVPTNPFDYIEIPNGNQGSAMQFKIELRGRNIQVKNLSPITSPQINLK